MNGLQVLTWIGETSLQAALLAIFILAAKKTLGKRLTPQWHYGIWLLVIVRLLMPSVPGSSFSIASMVNQLTLRSAEQSSDKVLTGFLSSSATPVETDISEEFSSTSNVRSFQSLLIPGAFVIWLAGLCIVALTLFRNYRMIRIVVREAGPANDLRLSPILDMCLTEAGVKKRPALKVSGGITSPALTGIRKPVILLPQRIAESASDSELRFIFLHELMHIRRNDLTISLAIAGLQAIHWFNPVLWLAFHKMKSDREIAVDAEVLMALGGRSVADYGNTLLNIAQQQQGGLQLSEKFAASVIKDKSETGKRIVMISKFQRPTAMQKISGVFIAALLVAGGFTNAAEPAKDNAEPADIPSVHISDDMRELQDHVIAQAKQIKEAGMIASQNLPKQFKPEKPVLSGKPFKIIVAEDIGTLTYEMSPDDPKTVSRIIAEKGVELNIESTTITCEKLEYSTNDGIIIAEGPDLSVTIGEMKYTAEKLRYNTHNQEIDLEGRPMMYQADHSGKVTTTGGDKMKITNVDTLARTKVMGTSR